ncbi:ABC transporter permease [Amycolatopsis taiwanensis]|uniref:ABC transporter permease n=1 Tax=Amycolatopsis taiwanensis TaxID=342230 RepID=UPI0004B05D79|nr:ABC transporter permease [Amycolatopsis taiwanensis]
MSEQSRQTLPDVIAAEWVKVRSIRSSYWLLAAVLLIFLGGCLVSSLMTADWDRSSPADQAAFGSADPSVVVLPFAQFCLAALGGLAITSEYGTGMIRSSLVAVPRRWLMLAGKVTVVGLVTLLAGQALAFLLLLAVALIIGDRPVPIAPWPSLADGIPSAFSSGLVLMVIALVGLGVGAIIRSVAGMLVTMAGLLFVLPVVVNFLPSPWGERVSAVMLPSLGAQLSGTASHPLLSPAGAAAVLVGYLVAALGTASIVLARRDA